MFESENMLWNYKNILEILAPQQSKKDLCLGRNIGFTLPLVFLC